MSDAKKSGMFRGEQVTAKELDQYAITYWTCPTCAAEPGYLCRTRAGWPCEVHIPRWRLARDYVWRHGL